MVKYKYLLLDFDGTLVDSKAVFLSIYNQLADRYNHKRMEPEEVEFLRKMTILDRCRHLKVPLYKLPFLVREFYPLYKNASNELFFIDGVKGLLYNLHKLGYEIVVLSSNKKENIEALFEKNNIGHVSKIFCSSNIFGKDKLIKKFLKLHKLNPEEVIYIGDEHRDIVACKKCGIKMIWVGWGFDSWEMVKAEKPDYKVEAPEEILELLS